MVEHRQESGRGPEGIEAKAIELPAMIADDLRLPLSVPRIVPVWGGS